jgi:hypothetical protein
VTPLIQNFSTCARKGRQIATIELWGAPHRRGRFQQLR